MLNMFLINNAVKLAMKMEAANNLKDTKEDLRRRAINWYSNTEIVDVETLAAVIMSGLEKPTPGMTITDIRFMHDYWFPTIPARYTEDYCTSVHY